MQVLWRCPGFVYCGGPRAAGSCAAVVPVSLVSAGFGLRTSRVLLVGVQICGPMAPVRWMARVQSKGWGRSSTQARRRGLRYGARLAAPGDVTPRPSPPSRARPTAACPQGGTPMVVV